MTRPAFALPLRTRAELMGGRVWKREAIEKWARATGREVLEHRPARWRCTGCNGTLEAKPVGRSSGSK
jgi:hypothetical protein